MFSVYFKKDIITNNFYGNIFIKDGKDVEQITIRIFLPITFFSWDILTGKIKELDDLIRVKVLVLVLSVTCAHSYCGTI